MPTSDLGALPVLIAACALLGLSVGTLTYGLGARVHERAVREAAAVEQRARGRRGGGASGPLAAVLAPLVPFAKAVLPGGTRRSLARRHARAGWPGGLADDEVAALALLAGVISAVFLTGLIAAVFPLAAPVGLVAVVAGPGLVGGWLDRRAAERDLEIARTMPFVLDLLVLTMRAGAPFNVAMERVAVDYAGHPIGREFGGVLADLEVGVTRAEALESLAQRAPVPIVRTFADDLNQAEELGRPVADTLQRISDRARRQRVQQATETAGKAKVTVLVPGMLVFIAVLILLFAPFAVRYFYGGYTGF